MFPDTGLGRLEKRIFGNGVLPEDCSDQVLPRLALAVVIGLRHEPPISRIEISVLRGFRFHSALRKYDQGPAHCQVLFSGHALDLNGQLRRKGDALADGCCLSSSWP